MGPDLRNNQPEMMLTQMTVVWVMKGKRIYRIEYTAEARAYAKFTPQSSHARIVRAKLTTIVVLTTTAF